MAKANLEVRIKPVVAYDWVKDIAVLDADDTTAVRASIENPSWHMLQTGVGQGGQPVIMFGWGDPDGNELKERPKCVVCGEEQTDVVFAQITNHDHFYINFYIGFPVCAEHTLADLKPDQYVMNNLIVEVG